MWNNSPHRSFFFPAYKFLPKSVRPVMKFFTFLISSTFPSSLIVLYCDFMFVLVISVSHLNVVDTKFFSLHFCMCSLCSQALKGSCQCYLGSLSVPAVSLLLSGICKVFESEISRSECTCAALGSVLLQTLDRVSLILFANSAKIIYAKAGYVADRMSVYCFVIQYCLSHGLFCLQVMMMKLPILPCAEKLESQFCLPYQKHEITPTKTVKTENGPISRGSQSEVSMVRDLIWGKRFLPKR